MHVAHSVGFATGVGFGWFYLILLTPVQLGIREVESTTL